MLEAPVVRSYRPAAEAHKPEEVEVAVAHRLAGGPEQERAGQADNYNPAGEVAVAEEPQGVDTFPG